MRLIFQWDVGVHLPQPGVLDQKRDRGSTTVPLVGEDHSPVAGRRAPADQGHRRRLQVGDSIRGRNRRETGPAVARRLLTVSQPERRMP